MFDLLAVHGNSNAARNDSASIISRAFPCAVASPIPLMTIAMRDVNLLRFKSKLYFSPLAVIRSGIIARMNDTLQFLVEHGYIVLFGAVLAQQIGLPLPS